MVPEQVKRPPRPVLRSPDEVPAFATEAEEAAFWDSHDFGAEFMAHAHGAEPNWLPPVQPGNRSISISFDADVLRRLRVLAQKKHKGYQSLVQEFVAERLFEEEQREGIIPR
jgi:CopG antitoxin of type II toxin-antitoxin system